MKVLTLTQPWATLIALGVKKIETRSWIVKYRGDLAIHASREIDGHEWRELSHELRLRPGLPMPLSSIVCVVRLADCVRMTPEWIAGVANEERICGNFERGRFGWMLENLRGLKTPVKARGMMGLWDPSFDLEAEIREALR